LPTFLGFAEVLQAGQEEEGDGEKAGDIMKLVV